MDDVGCSIKTRFIVVAMLFFCNFYFYVIRNNINVAIVAMVNSSISDRLELNTSTDLSNICPERNSGDNSTSAYVNIVLFIISILMIFFMMK